MLQWEELVERCQEAGVDAFEINFSCPHGMPERRMGMAMGQDCELLGEVCGWVNAKATVPVWAKMTPNITGGWVGGRRAGGGGIGGETAGGLLAASTSTCQRHFTPPTVHLPSPTPAPPVSPARRHHRPRPRRAGRRMRGRERYQHNHIYYGNQS